MCVCRVVSCRVVFQNTHATELTGILRRTRTWRRDVPAADGTAGWASLAAGWASLAAGWATLAAGWASLAAGWAFPTGRAAGWVAIGFGAVVFCDAGGVGCVAESDGRAAGLWCC
jgi:hypothetical protein